MGWRLLDTVETDTGAEALVLEKQLLIFLRKQYPNIPEGLPVRIDSASRYLLGTSEMFDSTEIKEKSLMDILSVTNAAHPVLFQPRIVRVRTEEKGAAECSIDQLAAALTDKTVG